MIKVFFFVQVCELVGIDVIEVAVDFLIVEVLCQYMAVQSDCWVLVLEDGKLLAVVNQMLVSFDYLLIDGDEVVFFLLVIGG